VVVDIGTGSGSAVLRRASREPATMFVAIDADAVAMKDASRRAARPTGRGGRANVIFLVAAADELPGALCGVADEATVVLPWGSLLTAVLDPAGRAFAGILGVLRPRGELTLLISAQERDNVAGAAQLGDAAVRDLMSRYGAAGLEVFQIQPATRADVELLSSGWGRRLGIPERRQAWLLRVRVM
jgi:SAM-dependent methyltransferase